MLARQYIRTCHLGVEGPSISGLWKDVSTADLRAAREQMAQLSRDS